MQGQFSFDEKTWKNISSSAKQLISNLLKVDPNMRPTAQQVRLYIYIYMCNIIFRLNPNSAHDM